MQSAPRHRTAKSLETLNFVCNEGEKFAELRRHFKRLCETDIGILPEVILWLGEEQVAIHATLLAAFSPYWRQYIHARNQDVQIIYNISLDLPSGFSYLQALKALLYNGETIIPEASIENMISVVKILQLEYSEFILSDKGQDGQVLLIWENHCNQLMKGLQYMCTNQLCTDLLIFVDGHLIRVHRLVVSAYSTVLANVFKENGKTRMLHLPGISLKSAQSLVAFMYYGKGCIIISLVEEFHNLCLSLKVMSLGKLMHGQSSTTSSKDHAEKKGNVFTTVEPEVAVILRKLQMLFDVVGKTDLTLVVGDKRLYTHKSLLGVACPTIHAMLIEEPTDEQSAILVSDADYDSVTCLLTLIYNGGCYMSTSQMKVATCYLDANLFELHLRKESLLSPRNSLMVPSNSREEPPRNSAFPISSSEPRESPSPKRNISCLKAGKMKRSNNFKGSTKKVMKETFPSCNQFKRISDKYDDNYTPQHSKYNSTEKVKINERLQPGIDSESNALFAPRGSSAFTVPVRNLQLNETNKSSNEELPGKRRIRRKSFNGNEWVTDAPKLDLEINCDHCNRTFSKKSDLTQHMRIHPEQSTHDNTWIVCKVCEDTVPRELMLSHMKLHRSNLQCGCCDRKFRLKSRLYQHLRTEHALEETEDYCSSNDDSEIPVQVPNTPRHECKECKALFITKKQLSVHIKEHEFEIETYSCEGCNSDFLKLEQLQKHRCKKVASLKKRKQLRCQSQWSTGEGCSPKKPRTVLADFACDKCKFRCIDYDLLVKHMNNSHPSKRKKLKVVRKYKRVDQQNFEESTNLDVENSPAGDSMYWACSQCSFRCSAYESFLQHVCGLHTMDTSEQKEISLADQQNKVSINQPSSVPEAGDVYTFPIEENGSFACPECGKYFNSLENFSAHAEQEGHGGLVGSCWICGICKNAFFEESQLNEHLVSHNPFPNHLLHSNDQKQQQITILDNVIPSNIADFSSVSEVISGKTAQGKDISHYKVEADSSVLDGENAVQYEPPKMSDSLSDIEMNVVTSSVNNETSPQERGLSPTCNIERQLGEMFGDVE